MQIVLTKTKFCDKISKVKLRSENSDKAVQNVNFRYI